MKIAGVIALAVAPLLGASAAQEPPASGEGAAVVVEMTDSLRFTPETVTIAAGETVEWRNPSSMVHTVTADPDAAANPEEHVRLPAGAEAFGSGDIDPGETWSRTFETPGEYRYFCIPHEMADMVGTVIVEPADEGGAAGPGDEGETAPSDRREADEEAERGGTAGGQEEDRGPRFVLGAHAPPRHEHVREAEGLAALVFWLGNFHPPAVSLPIGLVLGAGLAEVLLGVTRRRVFRHAVRFCAWTGGLGAIAAGVLGWLLAGFAIDDGAWLLTTHRWIGTGAVVWSIVMMVAVERASRGEEASRTGWRVVLGVSVLLIAAAGFFGGAMIYGLEHYALPGGS